MHGDIGRYSSHCQLLWENLTSQYHDQLPTLTLLYEIHEEDINNFFLSESLGENTALRMDLKYAV